jgi:hypothetical protein
MKFNDDKLYNVITVYLVDIAIVNLLTKGFWCFNFIMYVSTSHKKTDETETLCDDQYFKKSM